MKTKTALGSSDSTEGSASASAVERDQRGQTAREDEMRENSESKKEKKKKKKKKRREEK